MASVARLARLGRTAASALGRRPVALAVPRCGHALSKAAPMSTFSKKVVGTGTPWEQRAGCARAVRVGDTIQVSGTCAQGETATDQVKAIFKVIGSAIQKAGG